MDGGGGWAGVGGGGVRWEGEIVSHSSIHPSIDEMTGATRGREGGRRDGVVRWRSRGGVDVIRRRCSIRQACSLLWTKGVCVCVCICVCVCVCVCVRTKRRLEKYVIDTNMQCDHFLSMVHP